MPTRILREGIITSEKVNKLSEKAENFYRRLMSVADDYGRFYANTTLLRSACYPLRVDSLTDIDVKHMLNECLANDLLLLYGLEKFLLIKEFRQQTRSPSKFPEPSNDKTLINCQSNVNQMRSETGAYSESESDTKAGSHPPLSNSERVTLDKSHDRMIARLEKLEASKPYKNGSPEVEQMKMLRTEIESTRKKLGITA